MPPTKKFRVPGRRAGPTFISIPHFVLNSAEWGQMDAYAIKLLMELGRQYNGKNNGNLSATVNMLSPRSSTWSSKDTLSKKLKYLEGAGWIYKTRQGGRHIGCSLYAITWWAIDEAPLLHLVAAELKPRHSWKNSVPRHTGI